MRIKAAGPGLGSTAGMAVMAWRPYVASAAGSAPHCFKPHLALVGEVSWNAPDDGFSRAQVAVHAGLYAESVVDPANAHDHVALILAQDTDTAASGTTTLDTFVKDEVEAHLDRVANGSQVRVWVAVSVHVELWGYAAVDFDMRSSEGRGATFFGVEYGRRVPAATGVPVS